MLGKVFGILVVTAFVFAGITGNMEETCTSAINGASEAVNLSISMLGIMCLWNGIINVLDKAGFTKCISKAISPILRLIYPESYKKNIGMDIVAADYSANLLGLGNAALPIGISAMRELKKTGLPEQNTANNDMVMFATLNTAPFQLIPTTLIALRTAHGSANSFEIILPIWLCSLITITFGIIMCKLMSKYFR